MVWNSEKKRYLCNINLYLPAEAGFKLTYGIPVLTGMPYFVFIKGPMGYYTPSERSSYELLNNTNL